GRWSQGTGGRGPAPRPHRPRAGGRLMSASPMSNAIASSRTELGAADAAQAMQLQYARGSRALIWVSLLAIGSLIGWASIGTIDEVVRGEGKVVPSRQVQIVQSLDGGIVEEILVRPGETVAEGQVLLRIDPTRYSSSLGENRAELLGL